MPFHLWSDDDRPSRRDFLAGLAAGGAAMACGGPALAPPAIDGDWIALVSDTHINEDPRASYNGQFMAEHMKLVVDDILAADRKPAGVLFNGDLAHLEGRPGDYSSLLRAIEPVRKAGVSLHFVLGNHDDRGHFREAFKGMVPSGVGVEEKQIGSFVALGHRFLLLDSLDRVNMTPGRLGPAQIRWLSEELDADPDRPTLIFVHHNLRDRGIPGLVDHLALLDAVKGRHQVTAIVHGHTHQWAHHRDGGVRLINLPAVGYTFLVSQPIGYCRLRVDEGKASFELRALAGNRDRDGECRIMKWRY